MATKPCSVSLTFIILGVVIACYCPLPPSFPKTQPTGGCSYSQGVQHRGCMTQGTWYLHSVSSFWSTFSLPFMLLSVNHIVLTHEPLSGLQPLHSWFLYLKLFPRLLLSPYPFSQRQDFLRGLCCYTSLLYAIMAASGRLCFLKMATVIPPIPCALLTI